MHARPLFSLLMLALLAGVLSSRPSPGLEPEASEKSDRREPATRELGTLLELLRKLVPEGGDPATIRQTLGGRITELESSLRNLGQELARIRADEKTPEREARIAHLESQRHEQGQRLRSLRILRGMLERRLPPHEVVERLEPEKTATGTPGAFSPLERKLSEQTFHAVVGPALTLNCLRCHDAEKQRGDLDLGHLRGALEGGAQGPALVPGKSSQSPLYLQAAHLEKPHMPPGRNKKLPPETLEALRHWIQTGAVWGELPDPEEARRRLENPAKRPRLREF